MKINYWEELNLCLDEQHPNFFGFVAVKIGEGLYMGLFRSKIDFPYLSENTKITCTGKEGKGMSTMGFKLPELTQRRNK